MAYELVYYNESLSAGELDFLIKKEARERKQYYKVFTIFMIVSFVVPYIAAWYRVADGAPNAFSYTKFFVSAGMLLFISTVATIVAYRYNLRDLQRDLRHRTKTIERTHITRLVQVPMNNTFHFYIESHVKLSIEVAAADFLNYKEGDEISIEYTTYSHEFLGYF